MGLSRIDAGRMTGVSALDSTPGTLLLTGTAQGITVAVRCSGDSPERQWMLQLQGETPLRLVLLAAATGDAAFPAILQTFPPTVSLGQTLRTPDELRTPLGSLALSPIGPVVCAYLGNLSQDHNFWWVNVATWTVMPFGFNPPGLINTRSRFTAWELFAELAAGNPSSLAHGPEHLSATPR